MFYCSIRKPLTFSTIAKALLMSKNTMTIKLSVIKHLILIMDMDNLKYLSTYKLIETVKHSLNSLNFHHKQLNKKNHLFQSIINIYLLTLT